MKRIINMKLIDMKTLFLLFALLAMKAYGVTTTPLKIVVTDNTPIFSNMSYEDRGDALVLCFTATYQRCFTYYTSKGDMLDFVVYKITDNCTYVWLTDEDDDFLDFLPDVEETIECENYESLNKPRYT